MASKDLFGDLFNDFFGDKNSFRDINEKSEGTTESVEFTKGNYHSTVTIRFAEDGSILGITGHSVNIKDKKEADKAKLQNQLDAALEKEDYVEAARLHKLLKEPTS